MRRWDRAWRRLVPASSIFTWLQDRTATAPRNRCLRVRRAGSRRRGFGRRDSARPAVARRRSCGRSRDAAWHGRCAHAWRAQGLQRDVFRPWPRGLRKPSYARYPQLVLARFVTAPAARPTLPRRRIVAASPRIRRRAAAAGVAARLGLDGDQRFLRCRARRARRRLARSRRARKVAGLLSPMATIMLTHRPVASPLMSKSSGVVRTQPAPLDSLAQRPRVLARTSHVARQLSLFGRPGDMR